MKKRKLKKEIDALKCLLNLDQIEQEHKCSMAECQLLAEKEAEIAALKAELQYNRRELAKAVAREIALRKEMDDEDVEAVKERWGRRPVGK